MEHTNEQRRRLTRIRDGRIVAGVAKGIAEYLDINPWIVRAGFVALVFAGGSGFLIYIFGVLALPRETDPPGYSPLSQIFTSSNRNVGAIIALLIVMSFVFTFGTDGHFPFFPFSLLLIGGGLLLFRDRWDAPMAVHEAAGADGTTTAPTTTENNANEFRGAESATVTTASYGAHAASRPRIRRSRSPLGLFTLGVAILALGTVITLVQEDVFDLQVQQVLAVPILVLGLGLFIGTFIGRAHWLIVPVLAMLPFAVAASIADVPFHATAGERIYRPTDAADVRPAYELGAGQFVLDLSGINTVELPDTIAVSQNAGEMIVVVPKNIPLNVEASEGAGEIEVFNRHEEDLSPSINERREGTGKPLQLNLRNGFGHMVVTDDPTEWRNISG